LVTPLRLQQFTQQALVPPNLRNLISMTSLRMSSSGRGRVNAGMRIKIDTNGGSI
jgi:hypothetical protein